MSCLGDNNPPGYHILILLLLISGALALLISTASAGSGVTISAEGDKSYYLGENVFLHGQSGNADTVYLLLYGPNIPSPGVALTSPNRVVMGDDPASFTMVKANDGGTWEYAFYTANLRLDAGSYTLYALDRPVPRDQLGSASANTSIILKKPFITAKISPDPVVQGKAFAVTGFAEGDPPFVQVWIIGNNHAFTTRALVNQDASFTYSADAAMSANLPAGQNYLVVQHPMMDNQFSIGLGGDYVRSLNPGNGTILFRITGPGSLQGSDAADALTTALSTGESGDKTYTNDTFAIIPFQVTGAESTTPPPAVATAAPVASPTAKHSPLGYAAVGALALVAGMAVWRRR